MAAIDVLAEECRAFQWHFSLYSSFTVEKVIGSGLSITLPLKPLPRIDPH